MGDTANAEIFVHFIRVVLPVFIWAIETSAIYPFVLIIRIIRFVCGITFGCLDRQATLSVWGDEEEMVKMLPPLGTKETGSLVSLVEEKSDFVVVTCSEINADQRQLIGFDYFS